MPNPVYPFFTALMLFAGGLIFSSCQEKRTISSKVPSISLKSYSGETLSLAGDDKGVTLLVFWATWCQPCLMEMPTLVKLHDKYRDQNFRVVSVNVDDPEGQKVKSISRDYGLNYPVLIGNEDVMKQFGGIVALPTAFLIGRDGRIREKLQGLQPEAELEQMVVSAIGQGG